MPAVDYVFPTHTKQLYRWVAKQREQWKLAQSNDPKAQITPSQIQQLVQIGLGTSIGPTNPRWEALFAELKKFKQEHGHLRVPSMEKEFAALYKVLGSTLGASAKLWSVLLTLFSNLVFFLNTLQWVIRQRQDWRKVLNGDTSTGCLDTEQIERLIDIGLGNASGPFDFNSEIKAQEWNDKYNLLVEFHKEHQHAEVIDRKEPDQYSSLAAWISKFREVSFLRFLLQTAANPCPFSLATFSETQRASYQNRQSIAATGEKKDKKGGVMTDDQFKKLKALGMRMEVIKQPDFDTRFAQRKYCHYLNVSY